MPEESNREEQIAALQKQIDELKAAQPKPQAQRDFETELADTYSVGGFL